MNILDKLKVASAVRNTFQNPEIFDGIEEFGILRLEYEIDEVNILDILVKIRNIDKIYWCNRDKSFEAVATYDLVTNQYLTEDEFVKSLGSGIRYYGSQKFDLDTNVSKKWAKFGTQPIVVPLWSIERIKDKYFFVINISKKMLSEISVRGVKSVFAFELSYDKLSENKIKYSSITHAPNHEKWVENIEECLTLLDSGELKKIVMARMSKVQLSAKQRPDNIFTNLIKDKENSYAFYFQMDTNSAFMGVSPEMLFKTKGNVLICDALAGSAPRGNSPEEDEAIAANLLQDAKELNEHKMVALFLRYRLSKIADKVKFIKKLSIRKLQNIQHIHSQLKAKMQANPNPLVLIENLSPTPAVAGFPQRMAMEVIKSIEKFDRGHYAGAVGTMSAEDSEFCVAIRSALYFDNQLYVYSGAGIVPDSDPEKEWEEIENKMKNFTEIFVHE